MITSWTDLREYVAADKTAFLAGTDVRTFTQPQFVWTVQLRVAEWATNCWRTPPGRAAAAIVWRFVRMRGVRLGFTIPRNVCGPGLALRHWGPITLNVDARVGQRCVIHPGVTLGVRDGAAPVVGDDCYLGPGAKAYGGITIGSGCRIGPNAVVHRDLAPGSVVRPAPSVVIEPAAAPSG